MSRMVSEQVVLAGLENIIQTDRKSPARASIMEARLRRLYASVTECSVDVEIRRQS